MKLPRALVLALVCLALASSAFLLHRHGPSGLAWLPGCVIHRLTGLDCPGCGMTRAAYATLHGRIGDAFRLNPLGMILLPAALLGLGLEAIGWARGKPLPFRLGVGRSGGWILLGVILAFGILRNIPAWPFTLLAPP